MFLFNCISVVTNIGQQLNSVTTYKIKSRISYPFPAESQNILSLMFEKKNLSQKAMEFKPLEFLKYFYSLQKY